MTPVDLHIARWVAWSPRRPDRAAWHDWAGIAPPPPAAEGPAVPVLLRRRVGKLGQQALRAAWELQESRDAQLVFASRHGEIGRTVSILEALARREAVSPADFSLSVHHALEGLLSIAAGNRRGHGAVAAGAESLWYGLIEAAGCLADPQCGSVVLVYQDEPLPPPYDSFSAAGEETLALALVLSREGGAGLRLSASPVAPGQCDPRPGEALLGALLRRGGAEVRGERHVWRVACGDVAA
jgi:hypothetical protein